MADRSTKLAEVLGGKTAKRIEQALDLATVGEFLRHYPRRMNSRGDLVDLSKLVEGENVTVEAEIASCSLRRIPGRKMSILEVVISSGQHRASLSFFNQPWREKELQPGRRGLFAGKVGRFRNRMQFNQPEYLLFTDDESADGADFAGSVIPIYPAAAGLPSWVIASAMKHVLEMLDPVPESLPADLLADLELIGLDRALRQIHRPDDLPAWRTAKDRLKFDEAFGVQLVLAQRRHAQAANPAVARPPRPDGLVDALADRLPFQLTGEQAAIGELISAELAAEHPMHRLLQGEVGSGKTVVALRAMLQVVDAGAQAALLAPTEVLAAQHAVTIADLLGDLAMAGTLGGAEQGTRLVLLTGSMSAPTRRAALLEVASGSAGIVVGTHALIQDQVQFAELGMVVVDEQHRFGVEQRDALRGKAAAPPHMLVMTATPIPRTVAMTVFGDLEVSALHEIPAGRQPIASSVAPIAEHPAWYDRIWQRVREDAAKGHQAFVVCPRIGEDDELEDIGVDADDEGVRISSVLGMFAQLSATELAGLRVGMLHGRMAADEKAAAMGAFAAGELDVLVATTVIEVGVNVPNATLMVILDADRFGVSQLHQLRGRVGRGAFGGTCIMHTQLPGGHPAAERLQAVARTSDGFELAELDLQTRREGDVLGAAQSGRQSGLKLLSLLQDVDTIELARTQAQQLIDADPTLANHPELQAFLVDTFDTERTEFLHKS